MDFAVSPKTNQNGGKNYSFVTNRAQSAFAASPPPRPLLPRRHKLPNERLHYFTPLPYFAPFLLCNLFHAEVPNPLQHFTLYHILL